MPSQCPSQFTVTIPLSIPPDRFDGLGRVDVVIKFHKASKGYIARVCSFADYFTSVLPQETFGFIRIDTNSIVTARRVAESWLLADWNVSRGPHGNRSNIALYVLRRMG